LAKTTVDEHRQDVPQGLRCGVITASDTRTMKTDTGGKLVVDLLEQAGHEVVRREIIPDAPTTLRQLVGEMRSVAIEVVLITGGTGITSRDWTFDLLKEFRGHEDQFREEEALFLRPILCFSLYCTCQRHDPHRAI
jgi:molybdenum cofactor biosynthesis protein B